MPEHTFSMTRTEAELLSRVISNSLTGVQGSYDPQQHCFLLTFKYALERAKPGPRPQVAGVEGLPFTRLLDPENHDRGPEEGADHVAEVG